MTREEDEKETEAAAEARATAADEGNPDGVPGVGARSGYGTDTGEENEGYPDGTPEPASERPANAVQTTEQES
jgi:hypothetical protein